MAQYIDLLKLTDKYFKMVILVVTIVELNQKNMSGLIMDKVEVNKNEIIYNKN